MAAGGNNDSLKVSTGDNLSATKWNRVIDRLPENQSGTGTSVGTLRQEIVFGKAINDVALGEVRGLGDFYGDPAAPFNIGDGDIVDLAEPIFPTTCHMLLVPRQPINSDEIGPAVYDGGVLVRFREETTQPQGNYCFPDPVDPTYMKRSTSGYKISTVVSTDYSVASLGDVQQIWKFELLDNYNGSSTALCKLLTLDDEEFAPSVEVHFLNCGTLPSGSVGYCVFANGEFHAIEVCQDGGGGGQSKRIRFVLEGKFNDTGQALANVLDSFGNTGLTRGDQVVVNDPRKLFAHAIGFQNMNFTPAQVSDFPCGGSIGYAVWTEAPDIDPPSTAEYPRYEVEQCTQTVSKMKVFVYESGSGSTGTVKSRPTGEDNETPCTLYFSDHSNFASRWPDVDYCESWTDAQPDPAIPEAYKYKLLALNPHRFSANRGSWCMIEKSSTPQRAENACNDLTPYAGIQSVVEWTITDVQLPIARWIKVEFVAKGVGDDPDLWGYSGDYAEGEDPSVAYFRDNVIFSSRIRTAPGMEVGCMTFGEIGWAFWDPNEQFYNVVVTNSALYGSPIDVKVIGHTDLNQDLLSATGCALSYPEFKSIPVFGVQPPDCEVIPTSKTVALATTPVDVVTGATIVGTEMCLSTDTIYVCDTGVGPNPPICLDVCDPCVPPPETGCCENYDGTYTPGVTQTDCENPPDGSPPGTYLGDGSECPTGCLVECSECSNGGASFAFDGLSWSGTQTGSGQSGHADETTATWSAGSDCCATLSVTLKSDDPFVSDVQATAQVCITQPSQCQNAMLELELTWSPATFDGVTLPTNLGAGVVTGCSGTYGQTGGCIIPDQPDPNTPSGTWDECDITVTDCTI